jgi:hypothetical protein
MRRVDFAEWILSCTMSRERAGAAAGDLAEFPGRVRFWISVTRLAVSASFKSLAQAPLKFAGGAAGLWIALQIGSAVCAVGASLAWAVFYLVAHHTGLEWVLDWAGHPVPWVPPSGASHLVGRVLIPAWVGWKMGVDLSRKYPGSELAAWCAVAATWSVLGVAAKLPPDPTFLPVVCVLGGMLRARWVQQLHP